MVGLYIKYLSIAIPLMLILNIPIYSGGDIKGYDTGFRYNIQGWVYVQIKGDPYHRGYQHGYLLSDEIVDLMHRWSNMIHNHPKLKLINRFMSQKTYDRISCIWWDFCKNLAEKMYWDEYPEEYKEEIRGIAAGATDHGGMIYGDPITYKDVLASNEMYEMMSKLTYRKFRKGFHPLRSLYYSLKPEISKYQTLSFDEFEEGFTLHHLSVFPHHCSSFIATGDATRNNEIIISNSMWSSSDGTGLWWWSYYIAIRWNIILDVIPTNGHRFQMVCAPGYIWSNHDFYQNNEGIMFIETTLPQGFWSEKGLPLAIRARKAVQYASSIDDVIYYLRYRNDGVMNAIWLIGDAKTGEIARYELGLFHDAIVNRTKNGFLWSSNNPMDFWVRWEKMDWRLLAKRLLYYFLFGLDGYQYHTPRYHPANRDIKFKELGEKYYGRIDVDIVKKIMSTDPIGTYSPDCKITTSSLVRDNGIWVFTGNPSGKILSMINYDTSEFKVEDILPVGWVRIYGLPDDHTLNIDDDSTSIEDHASIQWNTSTGNNSNDFISKGVIVDDILYETTSNGVLLAISLFTGDILYTVDIGLNPTKPVYKDGKLFIGSSKGLEVFDLAWKAHGVKEIGRVVSPPVIDDKKIYVGNIDGYLYAIDIVSGEILWNRYIGGEIETAGLYKDSLIVAAGKTCYAIDRNNSDIIWSFNTNGVITSQPSIYDNMIYFGSWDTNIYALYASNGTLKWSFETGWGVDVKPVLYSDVIYVGSTDNNFYAIDASTGLKLWEYHCNAAVHSSIAVSDNTIVFGSDDGNLYALNSYGEPLWVFTPGRSIKDEINYFTTPIRSTPIIQGDTIYIGIMGNIYALLL